MLAEIFINEPPHVMYFLIYPARKTLPSLFFAMCANPFIAIPRRAERPRIRKKKYTAYYAMDINK